jgi:hypothetical protein
VLEAAGEFFELCLWESKGAGGAHRVLSREGLDEEVIRSFGVGYAPMAPYELIGHLAELGYSGNEIVASGLANRSVRGRLHAQFRSRVMFPVRDRDDRLLGFAGLGTHLGPSWSLWVTSPDNGLYRRSEAVYGLDRAAGEIADSSTALVRRDSIDVLRSHQDGQANAVTVHSGRVTPQQVAAMAEDVPGGAAALELDLPPGMPVDSVEEEPDAPKPRRIAPADRAAGRDKPDRLLELKKLAIVIATGLAAINVWTVAPLIAIWLGSQAQGGQVVSLRGVFTVLVVMGVLAFLLAWALTWLHAKYDALTGRPPIVGQTSPWGRRMRGELNEQFRTVYGLNAPERVVAACVLAAVLAFEIWFFFFAGSSIG